MKYRILILVVLAVIALSSSPCASAQTVSKSRWCEQEAQLSVVAQDAVDNHLGKDEYTRRLISIATEWKGSELALRKALAVLIKFYNSGIPGSDTGLIAQYAYDVCIDTKD